MNAYSNRLIHIHAGLPKTGTTALQSFLKLNKARLAAAGLHLPQTGYEDARGNHHALAQGLGSYNPLERKGMVRAVAKELEVLQRGEVLISSEFAYLMTRYAKGASGFRSLKSRGFTLKFYLFVRPQPDLAVSSHAEFLRNMVLPQPFDRYLERNFPKLGGDFNEALDRLEAISPGNVTVLPFSKPARQRGIWWDLLSAMGYSLPDQEQTTFNRPGMANLSMNGIATAALFDSLQKIDAARSIRRWSRRRRLREVLLRTTEGMKGAGMPYNPLTADARRRLWQASEAQNEALAQKHWGQEWNEVFATEKAADKPYFVFDASGVEAGSSELAEYHAHCSTVMSALLSKIERLGANSRWKPRSILGYPLDYAGDQILRAIVLGR